MAWGGEERRKIERYCEGHLAFCEDMAIVKTTILGLDKRINGTIGAIEKHIENSRGRNLGIILAFLGMITWLFTQGISYGESKRQIAVNTDRWNKYMEIEQKIR
jgi:hypothetical protein